MIVNLSHIEVAKLHQAEIRAEVARNHLIAGATRPSSISATSRPVGSVAASLRDAVGNISGGLRQAVTSLAARASIG